MVWSSFPKDGEFQEILTYITPLKIPSQLWYAIKGGNVFSMLEWPIWHKDVTDLLSVQ